MDELVENLVELRAVFADERALGAISGLTRFAVGVNLIRAELGDGQLLAVEGDARAGDELGVRGGQRIFLLQQTDDLGLEGFQLQLDIQKQKPAVLFLQRGAEGAFVQRAHKALRRFVQQGRIFVDKRLLGLVKRVAGIDGIADLGDGQHRADVLGDFFVFVHAGGRFVGGRGVPDPLGQRRIRRADLLDVYPFIPVFRKLHIRSPFPFPRRASRARRHSIFRYYVLMSFAA